MVSQCELSNCRCTCNHQSHDRSKERSCCCAQLQLYWPAGLQLKLYHLGLHGVDCTFQRLPCSSACLVPCFSPHKLASTLRFATLSQGLRGFSQTGMMKHIMFGTKMCISFPPMFISTPIVSTNAIDCFCLVWDLARLDVSLGVQIKGRRWLKSTHGFKQVHASMGEMSRRARSKTRQKQSMAWVETTGGLK